MNPTKQLYEAAKICLELLGKIQVKTTGTKPVILDQYQACIVYNMRNKLSYAITAYEQSNEQPEPISRHQENGNTTNGEKYILDNYGERWADKYETWASGDVIDALNDFASQQTADKDRQLQVQQSHIDDQDQLIFEQGKEIDELKVEITAFKLVIDEITDGDCLKQSKAKLSAEIKELKAEVERLKQQRSSWARFILKVRDGLVENDAEEAYHWLYQIASPNFDKDIDEVWKEIEEMATTFPTNKVNNH